jgi:hypothetical protein
VPPDFALAGEVLDEIIETVYVLENLTFLAQKTGMFTFDLRKLLEQYIGDVQLVTEFTYYRTDIVGRFHEAMLSIHKQYPEANLHIVAHSEGTVVSFLALLYAMSGRNVFPANATVKKDARVADNIPEGSTAKSIPDWLRNVRGFMTIGSPIDKHLLLWRRLWDEFDPALANGKLPAKQIRWRNYYDYGDPVGFKLETARLWLDQKKITIFEFCGCKNCRHDIGFARYLLPGEAHNEYWSDPEVFEHFVTNVVREKKPPKPPPRSKPLVALLSPVLPYVASFLLLMLGVFLLFRAVHAYTDPTSDPLQKFVRFTQLGVKPEVEVTGGRLFSAVCGISALIAGATLLARFPRLAVGWVWKLVGFVALLAGCVCYVKLVPYEVRNVIGARFSYLARHKQVGSLAPTLGILGVTAIAGMTGFLVMVKGPGNPERKQRWLLKGMRPLILCGAIAVGLIVLSELNPQDIRRITVGETTMSFSTNEIALIRNARLSSNELNQIITANLVGWTNTVQNVEPVLATSASAWPVVLAGFGFLYLWWLSTLIFGLAFVWHRYIRHSVSNTRLREWNPYDFPDTPPECPAKKTTPATGAAGGRS